ncbi:urea transporter [Pseudanabaena yagii]|uniref:Peptidoglycan DD-metalloendopeptidase family protein n=1 Tax=Pseudanabaena yagii GIHE-NHR1 TaxID=2722753 RepID=A0ABX1LSR6_9CYAN|nr:urea transporter [Pseudanabaena yagii]NMF58333.1 peptidoglycan DD-metalloendopeptidase family protein [Pseudanabaena yagii GIHE-NHR1]
MIGINSRSLHPLKATFAQIPNLSTQQWRKIKNIWQTPQHVITSICAAVAEIIFLRGAGIGVILIAAMMLQPSVLIMGMTGLFSAIAIAAVMQLKRDYLNYAPLLFNPLLAGLGVGYLFQITPASLILAGIAGSLAFVLTWTLSHILRTFLLLPVLSLPFVAVSWIVHLAAFRYAGLLPAIAHPHTYSIGLPEFIEGFLRTLGLIFFLPNIYVGIVVMLLLLWNSRIQFMLAIAGYALGTYIRAMLTGTFLYVYHDPAALNFILVALAIGGFYLIPSPRSYCLAAIAVVFTALIGESVSVFWVAVGLPVHAFPYNLVTLSFLYLLGSVGQKLLARYPQASPEKTLDYELTARIREQGNYRAIALPFIGRWKVWQGVDGRWTHQGLWRYAYDFVLCDDEGNTYRNQGTKLTDYYAFQKPILSPISGWVTRVVSDLPDCAIGEVDHDRNWGNHVILYDDRGFYVEISHFAQNSIAVKQGDRLNQGALLGRCGNSGYSPQPHIHIQAQFTPDLGAATIPFSFTNLLVNDQFASEAEPNENDILEAIPLDCACSQILSLTLDFQLRFQIEQKTKRHQSKISHLSVIVRMAIDGTFYLDSGKAKLYFTQSDRGLKFHRLEGNDRDLGSLFLAMPSLPTATKIGRSWQDYLPISLATKGFQRMSYQLMSSFDPRLASARYQGEWRSASEIAGVISVKGDRRKIYFVVNFENERQLVMISLDRSAFL